MQGWRKNMEDARICDFSIKVNNKNYAVFGVFDGHGGKKISIQDSKYPHMLKDISLKSC
jgi:serine/threonine protein phosphatase PrpC